MCTHLMFKYFVCLIRITLLYVQHPKVFFPLYLKGGPPPMEDLFVCQLKDPFSDHMQAFHPLNK